MIEDSLKLVNDFFEVLHMHTFDGALMGKGCSNDQYFIQKKYAKDKYEILIHCPDFFAWGLADLEPVTDTELLAQCYLDCKNIDWINGEDIAPFLYCARQRKRRPQGACYPRDKRFWKLFDACGERREPGPGNPYHRGEYNVKKPKT